MRASDYQWDSPGVSLVGGWTNPFEKHVSQFGSFPQDPKDLEVNIKNVWNQHLGLFFLNCGNYDRKWDGQNKHT